jgi:proline iminopeptidase
VYLCPGGPANDCRSLAQDLSGLDGGATLVAHDYRGSGRSGSAPEDTYNFERLADDLNELRVHLDDDRISIVAHSMGGFVALSYALRHAQHCERLVLIGALPAGNPRSLILPTLRAMGALRVLKMLSRTASYLAVWSWRPQSARKHEAMYAIWATTQEGRPEVRPLVVARARQLGLPLDNDNVQALQRCIATFDATKQLGAITCPVLVLYGDRDAAAVAAAPVFTQHLRDRTIISLRDVGHEPFFEAPDQALPPVRAFLMA